MITAASAGGEADADAEAVQLAAARAAMEAAAEAVIASAIAVMAASNAQNIESDDPADSSGEEALAATVAGVVAIVQRDMRNAADALEATSELLAAAGALIGILGENEQRHAEEGSSTDPGDRVARLEEELDQSLAVFDDRMQSEGSNAVAGMSGEDSELAAETGGNTDPSLSQHSSRNATAGDKNRSGRDLARSREDVEWNAPRNNQDVEPISETMPEEYEIDDAVRAQDDDIIARQLREAAMAETDPDLREALWQEYRNYKESLETGEAEAN
ncbi:MAG: hypothetical protein KJO54_11210 [Gammaproteobacteria bacterium]|nr:hypothetical protein [Gammaproteobacteria bacterium]NNF59929.1 hypothetical protein [Gammaproteobacteria bacterium]NNM21663.1 hypothetical protein [Gammaproteobacteria bacterium]